MTATIEASSTNKDSHGYEVSHAGSPRVVKISLKNGGIVTVYDGSISLWESSAIIVENHGSEVKRISQPSRDGKDEEAHLIIIFNDTGWARITQNDKLPETNPEGADFVDVDQVQLPVYQ